MYGYNLKENFMSRSYKISIKNSVIKTVCVDDEVTTDLEILEVLPKEAKPSKKEPAWCLNTFIY